MPEKTAPKTDARKAAAADVEATTADLVGAQEAQLAEKIARQNARFVELGKKP